VTHVRLFGFLFIFALSFSLYWWTLAPTVTLIDSGELILAARTLGVAHPPGFPLYVLLAHVATWLPFGNVAVRVHLASALFAALAAAFMTLLVIEAALTRPNPGQAGVSAASSTPRDRLPPNDHDPVDESPLAQASVDRISPADLTAGVLSGALFACSRTLWAYATLAEVYTLNALLIVVVFWLIVRWRRDAMQSLARRTEPRHGKLYAATLIFGLALGVHHVTVALTFPALAMLVISTTGVRFLASKQLLYAMLLSFAGLSVYVYLPVAGSQSPLMNWGDPRTLEHFWWHISGRQYRAYFDFSVSRIVEFVRLAIREFGGVWFPAALTLAVAGLGRLLYRDRVMFGFLVLVVLCDIGFCLAYDIAEDKDAYYLPAFIALTIAAGLGTRFAIGLWLAKVRIIGVRGYAASALLLAVPLHAFSSNLHVDDRSNFFVARDYVENVLRSIEPHALLLTSDWELYSPSLYVREIENQRRDAVVVDVNLLRRSWYYDYLDRAYPDLMTEVRSEVNRFRTELGAWERDTSAYATIAAQQRINSRFHEMVLAMVARSVKQTPVYVTSEIVLDRTGQNLELGNALRTNYSIVPTGLVFRVTNGNDRLPVAEPQLLVRGLSIGVYDDDDVVRKKIIPVYLRMAMSSGIYFAAQGKHEKAIEKFKLALAIDPGFQPAALALTRSRSAARH